MKKLFISHSHAEKELVTQLIILIKNTTKSLRSDDILCTSAPGTDLMVGKSINTEIKKYLEEAKIICGLITHNSIHSEYVLFELGAGWAQDKAIAILGPDASITPEDIPAPLRGNTCIRISEKTGLYKLIDYICTKCGVDPEPRDVLEQGISNFLDKIANIEFTKLHRSEERRVGKEC